MKRKFVTGFICGALLFGTAGVFAGQYVATENSFPVKLNGQDVSLEGYSINDYTYFKLRDVADVVGGFNVDFADNAIQISTVELITPTTAPTAEPVATPTPIPTISPREEQLSRQSLSDVITGDWQHNSSEYDNYYTISFSKGEVENYAFKRIGNELISGTYTIQGNTLSITFYSDIARSKVSGVLTFNYRNGRLYYTNSDDYLRKME